MIGYVVRRFLLALSLVWAVSFGAFLAFALSFDPTYSFNLCGSFDCRHKRQELIAEFHLHAPILERYWYWLSGLPRGGFGRSVLGYYGYGDGTSIGPMIWHAAANTAQLLGVALVLVVVFSTVVGVVSARLAGTPLDWLLRLLAYVAWSMPAFLVGVLLLHGLGHSGLFRTGPARSGFVDWLQWISLPSIALALGLVGLYSRYIRSAMLVSLRQQYADVARAKGLSEGRVLVRHVLRNSLIPFTSVLSLDLAGIVGATIAIDYVFGMNGLAALFLHWIGLADPFVMTAILVVIAGIVAAAMFLSDLAVGWLDPRVRVAALR